MIITSTQNDRIKAVAALQRRKTRDLQGRYLVEGPNAVEEAMLDGVVDELFVTEGVAGDYDAAGYPVTVVAEHVLAKIATSRTPQGVVAVAQQRPAGLDAVLGRGFAVVLAEVSDPGNAGTIIRTADHAGAAGVVLTAGSVDAYNPKTVRAAAGSLTHLPVVENVDLEEVLKAAAITGDRLVALDASGHRDVAEPGVLAPPLALVFGSEAHGLDDATLDACDAVVAITRFGRAESLNLAAAVAITTHLAARQCHPGVTGG